MLTNDELALQKHSYKEQGYALIRGFFKPEDLKPYQDAYLQLVKECTGRSFDDIHDPELRDLYEKDQPFEGEIYNAVRKLPEMRALASHVRIAEVLDQIL